MRVALLTAAALVGCEAAPDPEPTPIPFEYPLDDVLRVNHLQAVGTHNSYHVAPPTDVVPEWNYTMPPLDEQLDVGVRQFELDVHIDDLRSGFNVLHAPVVDRWTTCETLTLCLTTMKAWSDAHPAHHPLMVLIEPKDGYDPGFADAYFDLLEAEILAVWPPERIVSPDDVIGDAANVRDALADTGWPTLGETRGTVVFSLLDTGRHQQHYTDERTTLAGRLMFANASPDAPIAGVILQDGPVGNEAAIADIVRRGLLVRTRADSGPEDQDPADRTRRDAALASGAHAMSTDFPVPSERDYVFEIEDGAPSRCNPITAPPECTAAAIEDPAFF